MAIAMISKLFLSVSFRQSCGFLLFATDYNSNLIRLTDRIRNNNPFYFIAVGLIKKLHI